MDAASIQEERYKNAKVTSSIIAKTSRLTIHSDHLAFLEGDHKDYYVVSHRGASAVLPIDEKGNIFLVKQYRHAVKKITLEIPAGLLDEGEEPLIAARRELREEIGMDATSFIPLQPIWTTPGFTDEVIHLFVAKGLFPSPIKGEDSHEIAVVSLPLEEVKNAIYEGTIQDGKTLIAVLLYSLGEIS